MSYQEKHQYEMPYVEPPIRQIWILYRISIVKYISRYPSSSLESLSHSLLFTRIVSRVLNDWGVYMRTIPFLLQLFKKRSVVLSDHEMMTN